jgi:hypothetical protein
VPTRAELTLSALGLIRHLSPEALRDLALRRGLVVTQSWTVYDLATAVIEPDAVWQQLRVLDRDTLLVVNDYYRVAVAESDETPAGVPDMPHLVDGDPPRLRPEVVAAIDSHQAVWSKAVNAAQSSPTPAPSSSPSRATGSVELALPRMVDVMADMCLVITTVSTTEFTRRNPDQAALVKALGNAAPEVSADWAAAVEWAVWAGFLTSSASSWWVTPAALSFVEQDSTNQLAVLVHHWWQEADPTVTEWLTGHLPPDNARENLADHILAAFPLLDSDEVGRWSLRGQHVGAITPTGYTPLLEHLRDGRDVAGVIHAAMPPMAQGVYPDSVDSLVATGPLSSSQQHTLSLVARCVRSGMAPRWVIDQDLTLDALLSTTATDLIDQLNEVVIGGLPQTIAAHMSDWEKRARALGLVADPAGTIITCSDDYLGELLLVDQKLQLLHLTRHSPTALLSRRVLSHTREVLLTAGYPTLPVGKPQPVLRVISQEDTQPVPEHWWADTVTSASAMAETDVWTEEILRQAIADKIQLSLCVQVGDTQRWMLVEPQSVANGRLRVKDTQADVERTLPLGTIVSMEPGQPPLDKSA